MIDAELNKSGGLPNVEDEYRRLCEDDEVKRVLKTPDCELDIEFLGFIDDYRDLAGKLPDSITRIVDLGCYAGIQSVYFEDKEYYGIDGVDTEYRYQGKNTYHYKATIQDYCKWVRNAQVVNRDYKSITENMFAFCCNVPNNAGEWDCVRDTFRYYRITYPMEHGHYIEEVLPEGVKRI